MSLNVKTVWGRRIAEARRQAGWSQEALARELSISQVQLSRWERGVHTPRIAVRLLLAQKLGADPNILFAYPGPDDNGGEAAA